MKKYKKELNRSLYKEMLDDICSDYCSQKRCVLKDFLMSAHPSSRLLMQMKCAEKFKKLISLKTGRKIEDIELSESMEKWIKEGYASMFADVYEEGLRYDTIYRKVMEEMEKETKEK